MELGTGQPAKNVFLLSLVRGRMNISHLLNPI